MCCSAARQLYVATETTIGPNERRRFNVFNLGNYQLVFSIVDVGVLDVQVSTLAR